MPLLYKIQMTSVVVWLFFQVVLITVEYESIKWYVASFVLAGWAVSVSTAFVTTIARIWGMELPI